MKLHTLVENARSCRRFDGKRALRPDALSELVNCARLCPSAGNLQPLRYITVRKPDMREAFFPALVWAAYLKDWKGPEAHERPTGYIVMLSEKKEQGGPGAGTLIDAGIAAQTMQLAASAEGMAACIFRSFNPKIIEPLLHIPDDHEILLVLALGYPAEERRLAPLPEDGSIRYYRDEQDVHRVPKRALEDVILGRY